MYMNKLQRGFTLLELMVTIAIVGIVATIALWDSSDMLEENRAENFLLDLKRNISFARSQAASTDEIVIVCPVLENAINSKEPDFKCEDNWDKDVIIITFINRPRLDPITKKPIQSDSLLRVMEKVSKNDSIVFTGSEKMLRFNTSGRITTSLSSSSNASFSGFIYCTNNKENSKALNVSQAGTAFYLGDSPDATKQCG